MEKASIAEVTDLWTSEVKLYCPHCRVTQHGFIGDPRGKEFECEDCGKSYKVHPDADVELE